ncbi:MAG: hypothetical protein CMC55_00505 [Flavobacteriaceae bacterium]|uniref:DUF1648 domain-containing protein n=1 Tax=Bizionia echini TaxID=649333 RepID=UPI000C93F5C4|nr:hypothetical protein [Flavobacteriaceae bacterium]|tara:strand:+ start:605 stop:1120 length:516 start_codon:yes stop_codon:yes gene_type:complete
MSNRPKLKLNLTTPDKVIELAGWICLIGIWIMTLSNYYSLPETIPIHYNGAGEADGFGKKWNILTLPIVSSILFVGLTILNKYPHIFNYPSTITQENALQQYTNATRLIRFLKLVVLIIFGLIVFKTIQNVNGNADGLGTWFLPLIFGLIFIPMAYYLTRSLKKNNTKNTG